MTQKTSCNDGREQMMVSIPFLLASVLFCVCLIAANLLETKQIVVFGLDLTAGLIVFPISYIINDCLVEVWGFRKARVVIWIGFLMNFLFVIFGLIADALPGAPYWQGEEGFHAMFGLAPRIAGASFMAFLTGSFLNAYVMSIMKRKSKERAVTAHETCQFARRAILSTIVGEMADSIVFFPLALAGVVPWAVLPWLMLWQVVLKTGYEIAALPITVRVARWLKRIDRSDVVDSEQTDYRPWKL